MKEPIEHQVIEKDGKPLYVLVPYEEYLALRHCRKEKAYIPHEVVEKHLLEEKSLIRAWREYKGLSQGEMAKSMGISQAAYSQMEKPGSRLRKATRGRIAEAMGVAYQQLEE
jgi:DNA-binding XRE family transcriptional regulator